MDTTTNGLLFAAVIALITHFAKQAWDRRSDLQKELRAKRVPIYTELLEATKDAIVSRKGGDRPKRRPGLTTKLVAWAPSDVIVDAERVWRKLESHEPEKKEFFEELEALLTDLLLSIRKDLGHNDQAGTKNEFGVLIARLYLKEDHSVDPGGLDADSQQR